MAHLKPISLTELEQLSTNHSVVPVIEELFSGTETPLSIYEKLTASKPGSFLLESAEQGVWSRYSFVGVNNRGTLMQEADGQVRWISESGASPLPTGALPSGTLALDAIDIIVKAWKSYSTEQTPPLVSGLVGLIGWDAIREIEQLDARKPSDYAAPTVALAMFEDLVVIDHLKSTVLLVANVFVEPSINFAAAHSSALSRIAKMRSQILQATQPFLADVSFDQETSALHRVSKGDYLAAVEKAKEHVRAGDVFQVVLSQRFDQETTASGLDIYRVLRALNPSPYMYLFNGVDSNGEFAVIGSSPEALVTVQAGRATMHPIAGSRPRGETTELDNQLERELIADPKESAEHLMLVDLARNDLLKVCDPASVAVTEFMQVHRFSHIMHLVSTVEGAVTANQSAIDVFRATFPAGTLSGAPKPRALEIIEDLEPASRGLFGGVVGYFDFAGNADLAIAIRTAFLRDGIAHIQAGAGIVLDSNPELEYLETIAKAGAPLRAVVAASNLKKVAK